MVFIHFFYLRNIESHLHLSTLALLLSIFPFINMKAKQQNFLFIGNSFTMRHELPTIISQIAQEGNPGLTLQTEIVGYGGRNLFEHWEFFRSYDRLDKSIIKSGEKMYHIIDEMESISKKIDAPSFYSSFWNEMTSDAFYTKYYKKTNPEHSWDFNRNLIKQAISKHANWVTNAGTEIEKFDYLVLQSWLDLSDNKTIGYFKYASKFAAVGKLAGAKPILYLTASYAHNQIPVSQAVARDQAVKECKAAQEFAKTINAVLVPVPLALTYAQESTEAVARTLSYRYKNDFHPNNTMAYLTACTFYAALYGKSPEGLGFNRVSESKKQNIHGESVVGNSSSNLSTLFNPDGGSLETVFSDEERLFLQRMAWKAVESLNSGSY